MRRHEGESKLSFCPHYLKEFDTAKEVEAFLNDPDRVDVCPPIFGVRRKFLAELASGEFVMEDVYYVKGQEAIGEGK